MMHDSDIVNLQAAARRRSATAHGPNVVFVGIATDETSVCGQLHAADARLGASLPTALLHTKMKLQKRLNQNLPITQTHQHPVM